MIDTTHHIGDKCEPPHTQIGDGVLSQSEKRRIDAQQVPVDKTTRWTDAERERFNKALDAHVETLPVLPEPPPWSTMFEPGSTFVANGWECAVRHFGFEGGRWMILLEPTRAVGQFVSKGRKRAEYKALVRSVGKKEARKRARTRTP